MLWWISHLWDRNLILLFRGGALSSRSSTHRPCNSWTMRPSPLLGQTLRSGKQRSREARMGDNGVTRSSGVRSGGTFACLGDCLGNIGLGSSWRPWQSTWSKATKWGHDSGYSTYWQMFLLFLFVKLNFIKVSCIRTFVVVNNSSVPALVDNIGYCLLFVNSDLLFDTQNIFLLLRFYLLSRFILVLFSSAFPIFPPISKWKHLRKTAKNQETLNSSYILPTRLTAYTRTHTVT